MTEHMGEIYQSKEEAEKSVFEFKIDQLEENIENLRNRIENISNPNLKRPLEIQLERKINDIENLKDGLINLEKDINVAENNDRPIN